MCDVDKDVDKEAEELFSQLANRLAPVSFDGTRVYLTQGDCYEDREIYPKDYLVYTERKMTSLTNRKLTCCSVYPVGTTNCVCRVFATTSSESETANLEQARKLIAVQLLLLYPAESLHITNDEREWKLLDSYSKVQHSFGKPLDPTKERKFSVGLLRDIAYTAVSATAIAVTIAIVSFALVTGTVRIFKWLF